MKRFLFLIIAISISSIHSYGQVKSEDIRITNDTYSVVINGQLPKKIKFYNAREWFAKTFGDYKSVLQYEDEENCKIIIKGISTLQPESNSYCYYDPSMSYIITLDCKDDRYRIKFEKINIKVKEVLTLPTVVGRTRENTYTFDEYILASEFEGAKDLTSIQGELRIYESMPTSTMKKKELSAHNESINRLKRELEESREKEKKKAKIMEKREAEVLNTLSSIVNSLSESVNKEDDF